MSTSVYTTFQGGDIHLMRREFDGIESPRHSSIHRMNILGAQTLMSNLDESIATAQRKEVGEKQKRRQEVERQITCLQDELVRLKKETT